MNTQGFLTHRGDGVYAPINQWPVSGSTRNPLLPASTAGKYYRRRGLNTRMGAIGSHVIASQDLPSVGTPSMMTQMGKGDVHKKKRRKKKNVKKRISRK